MIHCSDRIKSLSELNVNFYKSELPQSEVDIIINELCDGDLTKKPLIETSDRDDAYEWLYEKRIDKLNELLVKLAQLEKWTKK